MLGVSVGYLIIGVIVLAILRFNYPKALDKAIVLFELLMPWQTEPGVLRGFAQVIGWPFIAVKAHAEIKKNAQD